MSFRLSIRILLAFLFALATLMCLLPAVSWAQPVKETTMSLESRCLLSSSIVIGTIESFQVPADQAHITYNPQYEFTVAVSQTLKGAPAQTRSFRQLYDRRKIGTLEKIKRDKTEFVFLIDKSVPHGKLVAELYPHSFPIASADHLYAFWSGGERFSLKKPAYVEKLKQAIKENATYKPTHSISFQYGQFLDISIPFDRRAEQLAQKILKDDDPNSKFPSGGVQAASAIKILARFWSPENEKLIRSMLDDARPNWVSTYPQREGNVFKTEKRYPVRAAAFNALSELGIAVEKPVTEEIVEDRKIAEVEKETLAMLDKIPARVQFTKPVNGIVNVDLIDFRDNGVIPSLAALKQLREVQVSTPKVDISQIATARSLPRFICHNLPIKDLAPFSKLENLTVLQIPNCPDLSDLKPISGLKNLTKLNVSRSKVRSLEPLSGLTKLQTLNIASTNVKDISPLQQLSELKSLVAADTAIGDISPLRGLKKLKGLFIAKSQVQDLEPLTDHSNLQTLEVDNTKVQSLSSLSSCTGMLYLSFSNTKVKNLQPLTGLSYLTRINAANTQVNDVSMLTGLKNLNSLDASGLKEVRGVELLQERFVYVDH